LSIVARLCARGPTSIAQLTEGSGVTRQAVAKHLHILDEAGLVRGAREGRESDTVARIGGDEFAILLADAESSADAERVIRKISEALSRPFEVRGHVLELGISAGVAFYPADGVSGMELVDAADDAMYRNKGLKKSLGAVKMQEKNLLSGGADSVQL
jgi:predicted signal transduction protein with EAL and GGDEF domain